MTAALTITVALSGGALQIAGWIIVGVAALIVVIAALIRLGARRYGQDTDPDQIVRIKLGDGWRLSLDRHLPDGERRGVVVTCHGLGANRFNLDLDDDLSLVRYLAQRGFEVWNVELRGWGRSRRRCRRARDRWDWTFDDHVREDVPAILETVTRIADVEAVHWVGHSMGGMVIMAHLGRCPDEPRVASFCAVGSPAEVRGRGALRTLARGLSAAPRVGPIRLDLAARAFAVVAVPLPFQLYTARGTNLSTRATRRALARMAEPMPPKVLGQFVRWIGEGRYDSNDGQDDYAEGLRRVTTPACFIAGTDDALAPPAAVRAGAKRVSSEICRWHLVGRETGAALDYCHGGLLVGKHAPDDVFPLIHQWVEERASNAAYEVDSDDDAELPRAESAPDGIPEVEMTNASQAMERT